METHLLSHSPEGLKIWDVLFKNRSEKSDIFKRWVHQVFEGKILFKDLIDLAPKLFEENNKKYIELEFRPIFREGGKIYIDKLILIASDKTKELELKKQLEKIKRQLNLSLLV